MKPKSIDYSIIIPVYFNEGTIAGTFNDIHNNVISNFNLLPEVIFIDDGSRDKSLDKIVQIKKKFPDLVKIIKLTRNFGQVQAIMAGYSLATGKCVINVSADLQDPPELINQMLKCYFNEDYQIVIGERIFRDESWFKVNLSKIFYKIIQKISFQNIPIVGFDLVLLSDKIKKIILNNQEANPFWQGQIMWTGYRTKMIPYTKKRGMGKSRWTFSRKLKYFMDGIISYSYLPLRIMSFIGITTTAFGCVFALFLLTGGITGSNYMFGWNILIILVLLLSGIQMLMLGIIGEYLWRTLDQTRNRQPYIIEKIYE